MFRLIQAYSAHCVTLTYSQLCHILNPSIFRARGIFKTLGNFDQAYSEPCHSQNSLFWHYSAILRTLHKTCICRNLSCLNSCNIQNTSIIASRHIQNPVIFTKTGKPCVTMEIDNRWIFRILTHSKPGIYSEHSQRFKFFNNT